MTAQSAASGRQFVALDGLRGVAALAVVTFHFPAFFGAQALPGSYLAVDMFFGLSGFVIAHAYGAKLQAGLSLPDFMRLRAIRLYPLYALGFAIGVVGLIGTLLLGGGPGFNAVPAVLFGAAGLPTPEPLSGYASLYPINGPAWSLFFEVIVNVVYALIARHLTDRRLWALIGIGLAGVLVTLLARGSLDAGDAWNGVLGGLARVTFSFFLGVMLYRLWVRRPPPAMPVLAASVIVLTVFTVEGHGTMLMVRDGVAALVLFPAIIFSAASTDPTGFVAKLCRYSGLSSYGVYVLHQPVMSLIVRAWQKVGDGPIEAAAPWIGLACLTALIAASLVLDRIYDRPVRRWLSNMGLRPAAATAT